MRLFVILLSSFALFLSILIKPVFAGDFFEPNNKFGIHISHLVPEELKPATTLLNNNAFDQFGNKSKHGWGYITFVLRVSDLDANKDNGNINQFRDQLVPIYRLGSSFNKDTGCWERLTKDDAKKFADYFSKLNNTIKQVYIIVGNEPNHASEWGCQADPKNYAEVYREFVIAFEKLGSDYILMPAALDLYAPHQPPNYYDAAVYMEEMYNTYPDIFNRSKMLSVHCYPDNDFSGPIGTGRHSLLCYQWVNHYLKTIGAIFEDKPVCITETGYKQEKISEEQIADNIKTAYEKYWLPDPLVRCVTPFILNYCDPPFNTFSWKKCGQSGYRKVYQLIHDLPKTAGDPPQNEKVTFEAELKLTLVKDSRYEFPVKFSNDALGQRIYDKKYGDSIDLINPGFTYWITPLKKVIPGATSDLKLVFYSGNALGNHTVNIGLFRQNSQGEKKMVFELGKWNLQVIPPQALTIKIYKFPGLKANDCGYKISVKNESGKTVYAKEDLCAQDGIIYNDDTTGVIIGRKYQIEVAKEGYNNVKGDVTITQSANNVKTSGIMMPFDRNGDGKINLDDLF